MAILTLVLNTVIISAAPTYTDWFSNAQFLVFQSDTTGEYLVSGEFIEVAIALFVQVSPGIERLCTDFQGAINTIDLIPLPEKYRNDCFPMRLLINPSAGFHARIFAISC
jgi:hypothetical protein